MDEVDGNTEKQPTKNAKGAASETIRSIRRKIGAVIAVGIAALLLSTATSVYLAAELGKLVSVFFANTEAIKATSAINIAHETTKADVLTFLAITLEKSSKEEKAAKLAAAKKSFASEKASLLKNIEANESIGPSTELTTGTAAYVLKADAEKFLSQGEKVGKLASAYIDLGPESTEADKAAKSTEVAEEYVKFVSELKNFDEKASAVISSYNQNGVAIRAAAEALVVKSLIIRGLSFGLSLLIIGVMVVKLFKALNRKIASVLAMIEKVKQNNLDIAYDDMRDNDEFKMIGDSLSSMAGDIKLLQLNNQKILQKAESENQDLNDSIVELLETVFAMTKKDLTVKAQVKENVVGTIADSINMVIRSTNDALVNTSKIAEMVHGASKESQEKSNEIFDLSRRSKEVVSSVIEKVEKSLLEIKTISKVAQESKDAADKATESTSQALAIVKNTVSSMGSIRETISSTETKIKKLAERSQEIGFIVQLIGDISERTHVLALNATIQAAIAGDAGRGFAAIAEEIQKLAENTKEATNKIARLVENIQVETGDTIQMVNQTIDKVVSGVKLAESSGQQMTETQGKTLELADAVKRISTAIAEHEALTGEMRGGTQTLGGTQDEFSAAAQDQLMRARSLMAFALKLQENVNEFKTS